MARYWTSSPTHAASYLAPTSPMLFFSARACASSCSASFPSFPLLVVILSLHFLFLSSLHLMCVCVSIPTYVCVDILQVSEGMYCKHSCMYVFEYTTTCLLAFSRKLQLTPPQLHPKFDNVNSGRTATFFSALTHPPQYFHAYFFLWRTYEVCLIPRTRELFLRSLTGSEYFFLT